MTQRKAVIADWRRECLNLYFVGDAHVGALACDEKAIAELAATIAADEDAAVIGLGDFIEAIGYHDRRFDPREMMEPIAPEHLENPFYCQALRFCKLWESTKGKWLGVIRGNHESKALSNYHFDAVAVIAERLGCKYIGGSDEGGWLLLRLFDGDKLRNRVKVFVQHGWGGGELRGGDALKLQRVLWRKDADIVAFGHSHRPMAFPESVESIDRAGKPTRSDRWGVICYPLVGKHGYIARKAGNSPPPGYVVAHVERMHDGSARIGVEMRSL